MTKDLTLGDRMTLMTRMAQTSGTDFIDALADGRLGAFGLQGAVLRCSDCPHGDDCEAWLDARENAITPPPDYCRNRALLERIARRG